MVDGVYCKVKEKAYPILIYFEWRKILICLLENAKYSSVLCLG